MERPDLCELAARARTVVDVINDFKDALEEAYDAALGEADPENLDEELVPSNGDEPAFFETAKKHADEARFEMSKIFDLLATQQGYREFEEHGVEVS